MVANFPPSSTMDVWKFSKVTGPHVVLNALQMRFNNMSPVVSQIASVQTTTSVIDNLMFTT